MPQLSDFLSPEVLQQLQKESPRLRVKALIADKESEILEHVDMAHFQRVRTQIRATIWDNLPHTKDNKADMQDMQDEIWLNVLHDFLINKTAKRVALPYGYRVRYPSKRTEKHKKTIKTSTLDSRDVVRAVLTGTSSRTIPVQRSYAAIDSEDADW